MGPSEARFVCDMTPEKAESETTRIIAEAMTLPEAKRRLIAVTLLESVQTWPDPHDESFLAHIEGATQQEKGAALRAALDVGLRELEAGESVEGSVEEIMAAIRTDRSFDDMK